MTETPEQERMNTENLRDYRTLRRSLTDRKVAGVAGGLGRHLNIDPTILRVAFVVLCFFGGAGFVLYGAAWLLVPEDGQTEPTAAISPGTRNVLLIIAAVVAALLFLGDSWGGFGFPWPLAIIALVVFAVLMNRDKPVTTSTDPSGSTAAYPVTPPPTPPWMPPTQEAYQPPAPRPDRGLKLFWPTMALLAIALGSLWMYDLAADVVASAYPALALTVVGVMLVVGAWVGRAGGLVFLGVIAAIALAITSVTTPDFSGDRRIDETPTSAVQVRDSYYVPAGGIYLDLTEVADLDRLDGRSIDVESNAGELVVVVPDGLDVNVEADIAVAGEARVASRSASGTNVDIQEHIDGGAGVPTIDLNLDLVVGSIEVTQEK